MPEPIVLNVVRPLRIRIMMTMKGPVFAVRCRACNNTFAYMADLDYAFESAYRHLDRHREQIEAETEVVYRDKCC